MRSDELKKSIDELDKQLGGKSELKTKMSLTLLNDIVQKLGNGDKNNKEYFKQISDFLNKIIETNNKITESNNEVDKSNKEVKQTNESLEEKIENLNEVKDALKEVTKLLKEEIDEDKQDKIIENLKLIESAIIEKPIASEVFVANQIKIPEEIKIKNPQKEIKVTNFPKQKEEIKINNLNEIKIPEHPKEIDIKKPKWFEPINLTNPFKILLEGISKIGNKIIDGAIKRVLERLNKVVDVDASKHKDPKEALAVKIYDKNGKVIDKTNPLFHLTIPTGGNGGGPSSVRLRKKDDSDVIEPATKGKQDEIIAKIDEVGIISIEPKFYEDTNFVTGDSPVILDFNTDLNRNSREGYIINDGAGDFTISFSVNGVNFGNAGTLKNGETYTWSNKDFNKLKITRVADSSYRVSAI